MNDAYYALIRGERRGILAAFQRAGLWCLSQGYRLGAALRNRAFDRGWKTIRKVPVPVVSVGNLTVGGTGKTPCVEYIASYFREQGLQVTLLSRGYGSETGRNDEAMVLEENLPDVPHLQGADRFALAETAIDELEAEVLVLDDGFQHRQLHRDLDLVLIDATCPWGLGYLLPRGLLREPIGGLKRADATLITRCDLAEDGMVESIRAAVARIKPELPIIESTHRPSAWVNASGESDSLARWTGRPVAAFCGIGNPDAFRQTLIKLGVNIVAWRSFPDHHPYTRVDVDELCQWAMALPADTAVVTTQKDLVKLRLDRLGERELWALHIQLHITSGQDALEALLQRTVSPHAA